MRTIQISIGEIIEATYADLMELYGDHELALAGAQATGDEVLARFAPKSQRAGSPRKSPKGFEVGVALHAGR